MFRAQSFSQARIVNKSGTRLVDDIARDIKVMLDVRVNAVRVRIRKLKVNEHMSDHKSFAAHRQGC